MSTWAVSISLGPVQRFIAAGRRSRDLWWGSTWLSDLTWRLARFATTLPGVQSVPLPDGGRVSRIEANRRQTSTFDRGYGGRVSNHLHLLVQATSGAEVARCVEAIQERAREILAEILEASLQAGKRQLTGGQPRALIDDVAWRSQLDAIRQGDFLEFFGAWAECAGTDPRSTFFKADQHLQAVKMTRTFDAPTWSQAGRQKSHLDPGRDSVLHHHQPGHPDSKAEQRARARLGIGDGEHLDALGFARRVACFGDDAPRCEDLPVLPFPPVSRMAADPWLRGLSKEAPEALRALREALGDAAGDGSTFSAWCSLTCDPDKTVEHQPTIRRLVHAHIYPFDASILFDDGLTTARAELRRLGLDDGLGGVKDALSKVMSTAKGGPEPYYAVLAMDGDGVGAALMKAADQAAFSRLVKRLDEYADCVIRDGHPLSLRAHQGRAFYAGGDDLLGYLPLDHLLPALTNIDALFTQKMGGVPDVSVSAGVVIAHVKDDLREVRQAAQEALDRAKSARRDDDSDRGYTCIVERPRSGVAREICGPTRDLVPRLAGWVRALEAERISLRTPQLLDELARLQDDKANIPDNHAAVVLARGRILQQIHRDGQGADPHLVNRLLRTTRWSEVRALAEELRISARLHRSWRQGERVALPTGDGGVE